MLKVIRAAEPALARFAGPHPGGPIAQTALLCSKNEWLDQQIARRRPFWRVEPLLRTGSRGGSFTSAVAGDPAATTAAATNARAPERGSVSTSIDTFLAGAQFSNSSASSASSFRSRRRQGPRGSREGAAVRRAHSAGGHSEQETLEDVCRQELRALRWRFRRRPLQNHILTALAGSHAITNKKVTAGTNSNAPAIHSSTLTPESLSPSRKRTTSSPARRTANSDEKTKRFQRAHLFHPPG